MFLLGLSWVWSTLHATPVSINVYLKLKPENEVSLLIRHFNQFLEAQQLFAHYPIVPYLDRYPLHCTLYLTDYDSEQIPALLEQVHHLTKQYKALTLSADAFHASKTGYVMLGISNTEKLQQLSNAMMYDLAPLRDMNAKIPAWAAADPERVELFKQYGSPSVLQFFNPHFSIFEPSELDQQRQLALYEELVALIAQFGGARTDVVSKAVGVGIADQQGQIIKELRSFELGK